MASLVTPQRLIFSATFLAVALLPLTIWLRISWFIAILGVLIILIGHFLAGGGDANAARDQMDRGTTHDHRGEDLIGHGDSAGASKSAFFFTLGMIFIGAAVLGFVIERFVIG